MHTTRAEARRALASKLAVLTPTWNRRGLLPRLAESLQRQTDTNFTWVVIDDASTDGTSKWASEVSGLAPFNVRVLANESNIGKCASLNRAFDEVDADFYVVIDSDDALLPTGIADVRAKVAEYEDTSTVGAIFFSYLHPDGTPLNMHSSERDLVLTRSEHDAIRPKYDGAVGYYRRVTEAHRWPEYEGETYIGETVLQLAMEPDHAIAFTPTVIGIAEYQQDGLTARGRRLRIANPRGMMEYSRLRAERAEKRTTRMKAAVMFDAYRRFAGVGRTADSRATLGHTPDNAVIRTAGRLLHGYWARKYSQSEGPT